MTAVIIDARPVSHAPSLVPVAAPSLSTANGIETYFDANESVIDCSDMAELSDSASSHPAISRPTTPLVNVDPHPPAPKDLLVQIKSRSTSSPALAPQYPTVSPYIPFALAQKAERILGLTPGTLAHAKACLAAARDEMRRLAESDPHLPGHTFTFGSGERHTDESAGSYKSSSEDDEMPGQPGASVARAKAGSRMNRAKAAFSVKNPSFGSSPPRPLPSGATDASTPAMNQGHQRRASVVLGTGGTEEELKRERRRKAADGVLYWQREVGRLEAE